MADGSTEQDFDLDDSPEQVTPAPAETPPQHDPLVLAMAQELGIDNAETLTPDALKASVIAGRKLQAKFQPKPEVKTEPLVEPEEPIDWLTLTGGQAKTEAEAAEKYDPFLIAQAKTNHALKLEAKKLAQRNEALEARLAQQDARRAQRQLERQLQQVCAERPDLFGEKPGQAAPDSPEGQRYQLLISHLNGLVAQQRHTTLDADARAAMQLFGPAPKAASRTPTVADYARAQLARPSQRQMPDKLSERDRRIQQKREELAEVNGQFGDDDDDADLLD